MKAMNAKQVLSDLYGLMMEMNAQRDEKEVLADIANNPDPLISKHLVHIRRLTAKANAHAQKLAFQHALEKLKEWKSKGIDEIASVFNPSEQFQLVKLFRKFDESLIEDESSLIEDEEFLTCMHLLKSKLDDPQP